ncbi:hypothetical protein [Aureimonas sp. AU40]|uniref:hypothetical protein n=1 Tax=Aureimonas sp. AU40 TaxID=1637747 RepID=UPI000B11366F|nr:hypothetical protein [Aureimonas sp. AU40]
MTREILEHHYKRLVVFLPNEVKAKVLREANASGLQTSTYLRLLVTAAMDGIDKEAA